MRFSTAIALLPFALMLGTAGSAARALESSSEMAATAAGAGSADPQGPDNIAMTSDGEVAARKKWQFATIGYVWFAGAKGKTDLIGPVAPVDIDLSFGDVLKNFKFVFMGAAEARHDRLVFIGDLMFVHLGGDEGIGIRDPDFLKAEVDSRTAEITLVGGYRVAEEGPVQIDLLAGGRMNWFKTSLRLEGPNREAQGEVKKSWFDPVIAARVGVPLGGKWSTSFYGDVGGFGIGSDVTWQAIGSVNYDVNHKLRLGVGWRSYKIHYDHGDFLYDVAQNGPMIVFRTAF